MTDASIKGFSSSDISDVFVGITPIYLNNFLQRKLYGIAATESDRYGETKTRIFNEADVFGIALAWMLFESGLRTQPIRRILRKLARSKQANAKAAANALLKSRTEFLVIVSEPRRPKVRANSEKIL